MPPGDESAVETRKSSGNQLEDVMGWIALRERGKPVDCHTDWPLFYMNDFSRLGLLVAALPEALEVLAANGATVARDERGERLLVNEPAQLSEICAVLRAANVGCELTDLVSCVYQG